MNKDFGRTADDASPPRKGRTLCTAHIRRLVRFPHINWTATRTCATTTTAKPCASTTRCALIKDLKQRGIIEDTLILFTSEFGRTPFTQTGDNKLGTGRDHNMYGFSLWMAGGGVKAVPRTAARADRLNNRQSRALV